MEDYSKSPEWLMAYRKAYIRFITGYLMPVLDYIEIQDLPSEEVDRVHSEANQEGIEMANTANDFANKEMLRDRFDRLSKSGGLFDDLPKSEEQLDN